METKEELIRSVVLELLRVANKYSQIEMLPIDVEGGLEITTREVHTIQAIGEREAMSVTDVATHFGVTTSAASQVVTKLAKKGFLEKRQAPRSNKEVHLFLTRAGWRAFRAHECFHGEDMRRLAAHLSVYPLQQIATLWVLLEVFETVMDERLEGS